MKPLKLKKCLSLVLVLLMIFTALPISSAMDDCPKMMLYNASSGGDYHGSAYYNKVYSVTFLDHIDEADIAAADTVASWDVSDAKDGSVMAWAKINEVETTAAGANRYDVYIGGEGGVEAHEDTTHMFYVFSSLEEVNGLENFKTGKVKSFYHWFSMCSALESIDLSALDTSSVTSFKYLFNNCKKLKYANLHGWDTSSATDMSYMFYNCVALKEVDLRSFDTSKVTTMYFMFYRAGELTNIYIGSGWTNESIANLNESVFNCCYALQGGKDNYDLNPKEAAIYAAPRPEGNLEIRFKTQYEFTGDVPEGIYVPETTYYEKNSEATVAETPVVPDGYRFTGWSTDATVTDGKVTVTDDITFKGEWSKVYKVNYVYIGEVPEGAELPPATKEYAEGETVSINAVPNLDGYAFVGWTVDDIVVTDGSFTMPSNDVTLYGYFKKPVSGVVINTGDILLNEGGETTLDVTVNPEDATIKDLTYESSDESVVKIDENGKITAVGEGTATITVSSKDDPTKTDTIEVKVKKAVTEVTLEKEKTILYVDETEKLNVTIGPDDATNKELIWESDDESIVKVDENGNITAIGEGTTTVTVTSKDDPTKKDTITVKVKVPVEDIVIENDDIVLTPGNSETLSVTVNPDTASVKDLQYTSSDESVVTVDKFGNITAVGEGTATITVTSADDPTKQDTITVTVVIPVEDITPDTTEITLNEGETDKITVTVTPDNATDKSVEFKSNDEDIVKVDENGNITAIKEGTTTITVTSKSDPTKTEVITVTVKKPVVDVEDIIVDKNEITLDEGKTDKITVTVTPDNATDKGVEFKSNDEDIVKVDENGNVTAVKEGTTTITVTSKSDPTKTEVITVTVKKPVIDVEDIIVDKTTITLDEGKTDKITVTVTPDNATDKGVEFKSNDEDIVKVDENGNITAVKEGTTTITVTSKSDPTKTEEITVTVKKPVIDVEDIIVDKTTITLDEGKTDKITVTVTPDNATDKGVEFKSNDENIVKVDENGNVTAVKEGTTTITVTSKSDPTKTEVITVTVKAKEIEEPTEPEVPDEPDEPDEPEKPEYTIEVPDGMNIFVGETKRLSVKVSPAEGYLNLTFKSGDESIATVDYDGNVKGISPGMTTITADFGNGEVRVIPIIVLEVPPIPRKHHIAFGKTDGIGWYEVSINGGDFFPQGPNSTLEVDEGSILVVRIQDMWIDDEFDFYVNGERMEGVANTITVVVDGYMLIGALSMDVDVPDVEESLNLFQRIANAFRNFFAWIAGWFK